MSQQGSNF